MESYGKARLSPGQTLFLALARSRSQAPTNRRSLPWMHRILKCTKHPNRGSFHDFIDFLKCLKHPSRGSLPRVHRACLPACFWSQVAKDRSGRQKFQKLQEKPTTESVTKLVLQSSIFWSQVAKDRSGRQKIQKLQKKSNRRFCY